METHFPSYLNECREVFSDLRLDEIHPSGFTGTGHYHLRLAKHHLNVALREQTAGNPVRLSEHSLIEGAAIIEIRQRSLVVNKRISGRL